jgi:lipid A 3-O-deacylase
MGTRRVRGAGGCIRASLLTWSLALAMLPAEALAESSWVPDRVELKGGYGDDVAIYAVGGVWDSICTCSALKAVGIDIRLEAQLAYWRGHEHPASNSSLWDFGLTPIFHWSGPDAGPARLFLEAGIGAHLLSDTRINTERVFSTAFQFGEIGVVGVAFGERQRYEIGALVQHISNGAIKEPNNGLTYFGAVFRAALP